MKPDELEAVSRVLFKKCWQTRLARKIGVSDRTVRKWVAGEHPIPPHAQMQAVNMAADKIVKKIKSLPEIAVIEIKRKLK